MSTRLIEKLRTRLIAVIFAAASLAPALYAQNSLFAAKVNVPFAFETAAGQHFSAGVYTIRMANPDTMLIQGKSTSGMAMTKLTNDGPRAQTGRAVFTKYGDKYFLRSVWVEGNGSHLQFRQSKAESRLQLSDNRSPTGVELALLRIR
jgi:hypothetical protein